VEVFVLVGVGVLVGVLEGVKLFVGVTVGVGVGQVHDNSSNTEAIDASVVLPKIIIGHLNPA
jgi:hypothetical protein